MFTNGLNWPNHSNTEMRGVQSLNQSEAGGSSWVPKERNIACHVWRPPPLVTPAQCLPVQCCLNCGVLFAHHLKMAPCNWLPLQSTPVVLGIHQMNVDNARHEWFECRWKHGCSQQLHLSVQPFFCSQIQWHTCTYMHNGNLHQSLDIISVRLLWGDVNMCPVLGQHYSN